MKSKHIYLFLSFLLILHSCKDEDLTRSNQTTFLKTFDGSFLGSSPKRSYGLTSCLEDINGDLVFVGTDSVTFDVYSIYIIKTDALGNLLWEKQVEYITRLAPNSFALFELPNGNYFINSRRNDEILILSPDGEVVRHERFLGGEFYDPVYFIAEYFSPVIKASDGQLYLSTSIHQRTDHILFKVDQSGNLNRIVEFHDSMVGAIWFNSIINVIEDTAYFSCGVFGGHTSTAVYAYNIQENSFLWGGNITDSADHANFKDDPQVVFGSSINDGTNLLVLHIPSSPVVTGELFQRTNGFAVSKLRAQTTGNALIWDKRYSSSSFSMVPNAVIASASGGYYLTGIADEGRSSQHSFIMKIDDDGNEIFNNLDFPSNYGFNNIFECSDGTLLICGYAKEMGQGQLQAERRFFIARLNANGSL